MVEGDIVIVAAVETVVANLHYCMGVIEKWIPRYYLVNIRGKKYVFLDKELISAGLTPLVTKAVIIATKAHENQLDKSGEDYIKHPIRVMLAVNTEEEKLVAVLHDVVEDTAVGLNTIYEYFGEAVAEAVDAITHRHHEPLVEYYERVKRNRIALAVKLADVADNMSRVHKLDEATAARLTAKYTKAIACLG